MISQIKHNPKKMPQINLTENHTELNQIQIRQIKSISERIVLK